MAVTVAGGFSLKLGPFASITVAVCGIVFSIIASWACVVPATEASTRPAGEPGGIWLNPTGRLVLAM